MIDVLDDPDHPARGGCLLVSLSSAWQSRAPDGWVEVAHHPGRVRVTLRNQAGQASTLAGDADYYAFTLARACSLALDAVQRMK